MRRCSCAWALTRLIEHDVNTFVVYTQARTVDSYIVHREISLVAEVSAMPIDGNVTFDDHFFCMSARGDARLRHEFL